MNEVPTLETPRLLIRPLSATDLTDFYEYASVPGVGEPAGWLPHQSLEESQRILNMMLTDPDENIFAIETKEHHRMIGTIGIKKIDLNPDKYRFLSGPELGYVLAKPYWGQGLMTDALAQVIEYLFNETEAQAIYLDIFSENHRSAGVAYKLGFEFQGQSKEKQSFRAGDFFVDYYMLTKKDWQHPIK